MNIIISLIDITSRIALRKEFIFFLIEFYPQIINKLL